MLWSTLRASSTPGCYPQHDVTQVGRWRLVGLTFPRARALDGRPEMQMSGVPQLETFGSRHGLGTCLVYPVLIPS